MSQSLAPGPHWSQSLRSPSFRARSTVNDFKLSGQFLAIGTFSQAPFVRDVTNDPTTTWLSSEPNSFPVNTNCTGSPTNPPTTCAGSGASAGIVTAYATGGAQIIAESASKDETIQTATATFSCPQSSLSSPHSGIMPSRPYGSPAAVISTITIYNRHSIPPIGRSLLLPTACLTVSTRARLTAQRSYHGLLSDSFAGT